MSPYNEGSLVDVDWDVGGRVIGVSVRGTVVPSHATMQNITTNQRWIEKWFFIRIIIIPTVSASHDNLMPNLYWMNGGRAVIEPVEI